MTEPGGVVGPPEYPFKLDRCRSCWAPVIWARTIRSRMMVNPELVPDGNVVLSVDRGEVLATVLGPKALADLTTANPTLGRPVRLRKSHFATCPKASEWRSRDAGRYHPGRRP